MAPVKTGHPYRDLAEVAEAAKKSTGIVPFALLARSRSVLRRALDYGYLASLDRVEAASWVDSLADLADAASDAIAITRRGSVIASIVGAASGLGGFKLLHGSVAYITAGIIIGILIGEGVMMAVLARTQNVIDHLRVLIEQSRDEIRKLPVPERVRVVVKHDETSDGELPSDDLQSRKSKERPK